jgi:hypothetical protein
VSPLLPSRRALFRCTNRANAERLRELVEPHGDLGIVFARRLADRLPAMIRLESREAFAHALEVYPPSDRSPLAAEYRSLMDRGHALELWARQSEFASTQDEALAILERMLGVAAAAAV